MIRYAAVLPNGEIVQTGEAPTPDDLPHFEGTVPVVIPEGQEVNDSVHYWTGAAFEELPPRPGPWAAWDGAAWFDYRTAEDMAAELRRRREGASLTTAEFLQAAMAVNLLSPDEAAAASWGEVPAAFLPAVEQLSAEQRDRIRIIWPRVTIIERLDPLIVGVAATIGVSDETLDALFGLAEYAP
jgi:hypothetical protein